MPARRSPAAAAGQLEDLAEDAIGARGILPQEVAELFKARPDLYGIR
jgi:hypothetical protein